MCKPKICEKDCQNKVFKCNTFWCNENKNQEKPLQIYFTSKEKNRIETAETIKTIKCSMKMIRVSLRG